MKSFRDFLNEDYDIDLTEKDSSVNFSDIFNEDQIIRNLKKDVYEISFPKTIGAKFIVKTKNSKIDSVQLMSLDTKTWSDDLLIWNTEKLLRFAKALEKVQKARSNVVFF